MLTCGPLKYSVLGLFTYKFQVYDENYVSVIFIKATVDIKGF